VRPNGPGTLACSVRSKLTRWVQKLEPEDERDRGGSVVADGDGDIHRSQPF